PAQVPDYERVLAEVAELERRGDLKGVVDRLVPLVEKYPRRAEGHHRLGIAYYELQDHAAATRHLSKALPLEARDSDGWRQTVEHLGLAYYFSHRHKDAAPLLEKTLGWKADDSYLVYALAMCYVYGRDSSNARAMFAKLFEVPADSPQASLLASHFMIRENFVAEAEKLVRQARKGDPELADVHFRLGVIALTKGQNAEAVEHFRHELGRNPVHPMAWHYIGDAYFRLGKLKEAIAPLERAIRLNLRNAPSYLLIANVYSRQGEFHLAENAVQQALSLDPRNYEAHFLLARIYQKTNRRELAKQQMNQARQLRKGQ
ncbi:MAG: tetratricopeptide repeat protein, partial [bacterium]|nr:tetratricopeptide repeat protein [bacterium]